MAKQLKPHSRPENIGLTASEKYMRQQNVESMKQIDIDKIVLDFETFCIQNGTAGKALDSKQANRYARRIINCYLQLKQLGKTNELAKLLRSENENVRLWAATHTLPTNEAEAKTVLEELACESGLNAFSAQMALNEWEKGNLKLTYDTYKVKW